MYNKFDTPATKNCDISPFFQNNLWIDYGMGQPPTRPIQDESKCLFDPPSRWAPNPKLPNLILFFFIFKYLTPIENFSLDDIVPQMSDYLLRHIHFALVFQMFGSGSYLGILILSGSPPQKKVHCLVLAKSEHFNSRKKKEPTLQAAFD